MLILFNFDIYENFIKTIINSNRKTHSKFVRLIFCVDFI